MMLIKELLFLNQTVDLMYCIFVPDVLIVDLYKSFESLKLLLEFYNM